MGQPRWPLCGLRVPECLEAQLRLQPKPEVQVLLGVVVHLAGGRLPGCFPGQQSPARCRLARSYCGLRLAGRYRARNPPAECAAAGLRGWAAPAADPGPGSAVASQEVSRELGFWVLWKEGAEVYYSWVS